MKIRKIPALLLAFLLIINSIPLVAGALEQGELYSSQIISPELHDSPENMKYSLEALENNIDVDAFRALILSAVSECEETVDVSSLEIPTALAEYAADFIWYDMPEAFNVDGMSYSYYNSSGVQTLYSFTFKYRAFADTKEEYAACFSEFKAAADKLLKGIENNTSLSVTEKALLLHDRLAIWTEYDYVSLSVIKHTAYGAFVKRTSVCQGYAMAYMYLLRRAGIESYYCSSDSLNHGWNIVIINDKPYHVDVTWDDRAWGSYGRGFIGRVDHKNFLRSTSGIRETGHTAYDFDSSASDTTYDNYFWQDSTTAFQLIDNEIYYIDNTAGKLKRMSDKKDILDVTGNWYSSSGGVWQANFSCLSSAGGDLLYSLPDGVYKYTPGTGGVRIYTPVLGTNYSVFGFMYEDGYVICDINNTPNNGVYLSQVKSAYTPETPVAESMEIISPPTKTEYYTGDSLSLTGLVLKINYSDGTYKTVTSGYTHSGFSSASAGTVKVTVSYAGFSASFSVTVKTPSVSLSQDSFTLTEGETKALPFKTSPAGALVSWSSSDSSVVTVNEGKVTALKKGSAVITASIIYNGKTYSDTCTVNVLCAHKNTKNTAAVSATCVSSGFSAGVYCNDCNTYISGHTEIPVNPDAHKWDEGKITTEATCSVKGIKTYTCQNNNSHTYNEALGLNKNNHKDTKTVPATAPTFTAPGYTEGVYCSGCKTFLSGHKEIPMKESTFKDSENAVSDGEFISFASKLTAGDVLKNASEGSRITDEKGNAVAENTAAFTGMTLILPDGRSFTLVCPGDVNSDGNITAADARYVLRASVSLEKIENGSAVYKAANVNEDAVSASDARLILRASVGLEDQKQWLKP